MNYNISISTDNNLLDNLPVPVFKCLGNSELTITYKNSAFLTLCEYTEEEFAELCDNSFARLVLPEDSKAAHGGDRHCDCSHRPRESEYRIVRRDGSVIWLWEHNRFFPETGEYLCSVVDETAKVRDREMLKNKADRDLLTGLINRMTFQERCTEYLKTTEDKCAAVVILDIDNFKDVNDTCGHLMADSVLIDIANTLAESFRVTDYVARIGGDEMMVLIKDVPSDEFVKRKLKRIQDDISECAKRLQINCAVTCSVGCAMFPRDGTDFATLYRHSDEALYHVKIAGKNSLQLYNELDYEENAVYRHIRTKIDSDRETPVTIDALVGYTFRILFERDAAQERLINIFRTVSKQLDASVVCLLKADGNGSFTVTKRWVADGVSIVKETVQLPEWQNNLFAGNVSEYEEFSSMTSPALRFTLCRKFRSGGNITGCFLAADCLTRNLVWTKDQTELFDSVARMIEIYINHLRTGTV